MENNDLSLTDGIYAELVEGLKTGLDWTAFIAKYGASKGPLYSAIGRFFKDMEAKVRALSEVQTKLDESGLKSTCISPTKPIADGVQKRAV